ncbi:MAG: alpha-glucuronidase family glycosyl hydrolase [Acidobacteriota bacterium]
MHLNVSRMGQIKWAGLILALFLAAVLPLRADTGYKGWLRYSRIYDLQAREQYQKLPAVVVALGSSPVIHSAQQEMVRGVRGMLNRTLREEGRLPDESAIVLGTTDEIRAAVPGIALDANLKKDGYLLRSMAVNGHPCLVITAINPRGVLYGAFALLRRIELREPVANLNVTSEPSAPLRWVNEWDNLDGRIERGYGGRSIFWNGGSVVEDLGRVRDYARLLASLGIDGCTVNNVNADPRVLTPPYIRQLARIADVFRPWGVRLAISVDIAAPKALGQLDTFDPLNPQVEDWWKKEADALYAAIPDFAGFLVKADSEGRPGPSTYGRTQADAANCLARALKPHGGVVFYRAFVYNNHLDWRNLKNDRARAAYDIFHPLDGKFDSNVVVQIKNGPIDFQVREPASPLFGGLRKTNQTIELQITQEYTGQQKQLCFLVPMWKTTLDFNMEVDGAGSATPVKALVEGKVFHRPLGGFVGVANVGKDPSWMGSQLAMANLYGFGRLAWNPNLSSRQIAEEWTRQTFGMNPKVVSTITGMLLRSWHIYEDYTGPLGLGTLTNILGAHYGPDPQSAEHNGWGQWIRADAKGIGMDRTVATGTGYIGQYSAPVAKMYESLKTCPENLLLFMHHVPYTHRLRSGQTVIQYVYDSHYAGAAAAAGLIAEWESLRGLVDQQRYDQVLARLQYQSGAAIVWRDAICNWFMRQSGIPDARGRVGHYPGRVEAESMKLEGYRAIDVHPWEAASGGKAIACSPPATQCTASLRYNGRAGWYNIGVEYFDQFNGVSEFQFFVNKQLIDHWAADAHLPAWRPSGSSSTRRMIDGVALRPGDEIRIVGVPNGKEYAPLDYLEIRPDHIK